MDSQSLQSPNLESPRLETNRVLAESDKSMQKLLLLAAKQAKAISHQEKVIALQAKVIVLQDRKWRCQII